MIFVFLGFLAVAAWFLWDIGSGPEPKEKAYSTKILLRSYCIETNCEVVTWEQVHPAFIHAEVLTHRVFSRNSSSFRAIPTKKILAQVFWNPVVPIYWGKNQAGMKARQELTGWRLWLAKRLWLAARWPALFFAWLMWKLGMHKQLASRILMPWVWMTVIITSTELSNYFKLRDHDDAQPEIRIVAKMLREQLDQTNAQILHPGEWHIPFAADLGEIPLALCLLIASGRLARTSYENHFGVRNTEDDVRLAHDLMKDGHMSPFEHCCKAMDTDDFSANLRGFRQYRRDIEENLDPNL